MNKTKAMAKLSLYVDGIEKLVEDEFFSLANGSPAAIANIRARLLRIMHTLDRATQ